MPTYGIGIMGAVQDPPPKPAKQSQGNTPPQAKEGKCVWGDSHCMQDGQNGGDGAMGNAGTNGTNGVQGLGALAAELNITTLTGFLVVASQGGPGRTAVREGMVPMAEMAARAVTGLHARPLAAARATAGTAPMALPAGMVAMVGMAATRRKSPSTSR